MLIKQLYVRGEVPAAIKLATIHQDAPEKPSREGTHSRIHSEGGFFKPKWGKPVTELSE